MDAKRSGNAINAKGVPLAALWAAGIGLQASGIGKREKKLMISGC
jgi:hypothetical protein